VASQLARHIVASQPKFVSVDDVGSEVLEKERSTAREAHLRTLDENRKKKLTEAILDKVVDGKLKKFFEEAVLLRQELTIPTSGETDDSSVTVEKWLKQQAKSIGVEGIVVEEFRLVCL